eukprot:TRINITY_DN782092_c0_g1_i1.p1 TRINITY_DN782092_c0_g1~~TRINITY_DN782092_c0_g1_i1.p1  ORF type:complete len:308 (-),score=76.87 TRINITY_DN782092_c0_g1_i1:160-1083(-)
MSKIAVIGASGQIGTAVTEGLLFLKHKVVVLTRSLSGKNAEKFKEFEEKGATLVEVKDMLDIDEMAGFLEGIETLISATPGSKSIVTEFEPIWLEAALKAGVKRFVPTEFGVHTKNIELGAGIVFDNKKTLHKKIFDSGIGWTFFYNGGIFDYFLPNLRFSHGIMTCGNLDLEIYTHDIRDIGRVAAMAFTDDRTLNKCVQMDFCKMTQREMISTLKKCHPDHEFEVEHVPTEYIEKARLSGSDEVVTKQGNETERERWGINYVVYCLGKLAAFTEDTIRTSELYPDYKVFRTCEEAIADPKFVFDK